jgi:uncharacterized iron-regulated membrane protein
MKLFFRKLHRWLGLLMAVQIIAWMGSGFYFALYPIETIRGEHLVAEQPALDVSRMVEMISPADAWAAVNEFQGKNVKLRQISLVQNSGRNWYRISAMVEGKLQVRLVDAESGEPMAFLNEQGIRDIASNALIEDGHILSIDLVTEHKTGSEYRGRTLPMWRVSYSEPESLNLYIDGWTGEVVTRRTTRWRIFDFLWMLHIMDFEERDDFNTLLLQVAALLGLLIAVSGVVFWALTTRLFGNRRRRHSP